MLATATNPAAIRPGDTIATKWTELGNGDYAETKKQFTRKVRTVSACNTPECVHLDNHCYDARFSRVYRVD